MVFAFIIAAGVRDDLLLASGVRVATHAIPSAPFDDVLGMHAYPTASEARAAVASSYPGFSEMQLDAAVIPVQQSGQPEMPARGFCLAVEPRPKGHGPQLFEVHRIATEPTACWVIAATTGATGKWTVWPNQPQAGIPWPKSADLLGWEYLSGANPGYGGGDHFKRSADTWFPSWAADNLLYTSFTDGSVHDDATGGVVRSLSVGRAPSYNSTTGSAVIVGDDPFQLNITRVATVTASPFPYEGRYPCGQLVYKGQWWYGTYYLDNPNATTGFNHSNYVGPNPSPNCGNWCVQGPMADFRLSRDGGRTWEEARPNGSATGDDNLWGETAAHNHKVKFGAPHWVDFGRELEHSPDGFAYVVGHGAARPSAIQAWMLGDEVYLARVLPEAEAIQDRRRWQFYAGGHGSAARWVEGDVTKAVPLVTWRNHTGVVTMTYFAPLAKYVLTISTASHYPSMVQPFDTYFLESDSITGPWSYVSYLSEFGPEAYFVHHPSKFLAARADIANPDGAYFDAFLMYSANFASRGSSPQPPNSGYHMNLQQARFPLSKGFAERLAARYAAEDTAATSMYSRL